ncbi:MAG: YdcF family protein [Bryobacterales bacterium]|nr:YdcF family protein [Bryobacteraceae bacterium]MDW8355380.1 YdcF family protein [Bryobacterales bacterium]
MRRALQALWRAARTAAVVFTAVFLALHVTPVVPWIAAWLSDDWRGTDGDVLIVLAADQLGDGTLGISSYWRAVYAVRAFHHGNFQTVVISGRTTAPGPSLAARMGEFMAALGVPRERIVLEEGSWNTRLNALYTTALVRHWPGKKVLLTSDFHMRRARLCFRKAGLEVEPAPFPDVMKRFNSPLERWGCAWVVGTELLKLGWYWVRGWV